MITNEQIDHFRVFGFLVLRQAFSSEEIGEITNEADAIWDREAPEGSKAGTMASFGEFVERNAQLTRLAEDDRIYGTVNQLLGDGFVWAGSEGNVGCLSGGTAHHWHADRPGRDELDYLRIKVMIYLDPTRKETGAFRVIPGSHKLPLHEALQPFQHVHPEKNPTFFGLPGDQIPCVAIESNPGDIVFFTQSLFHAVYGGLSVRRRFIALKFAAKPQSEADYKSLRRHAGGTVFSPDHPFVSADSDRLRGIMAGLTAG
jgi:ectoine hydroxylase-related dioxygenase (phytanoyl-CoA dioxygenase family)